jgi:hypothetical protein
VEEKREVKRVPEQRVVDEGVSARWGDEAVHIQYCLRC